MQAEGHHQGFLFLGEKKKRRGGATLSYSLGKTFFLMVDNFKCLEKGKCYKWMLKSFTASFLLEKMIFYKNPVFVELYQNKI